MSLFGSFFRLKLPSELEKKCGYRFKDRSYLDQAFSHRSISTKPRENYERLEFLGDAIIDIQNDKLGHIHVDSRPSDALAIALRTHTPILAAEEVMDEAIVWEDDSLILEDEIKNSPELEILEEQLQKAIDKEEYEIAARIRDKIKDFDG